MHKLKTHTHNHAFRGAVLSFFFETRLDLSYVEDTVSEGAAEKVFPKRVGAGVYTVG